MGALGSIELDGSQSYDTDYPTAVDNGFAYSWACVKTSPEYGASCAGFVAGSSSTLTMDTGVLSQILSPDEEATVMITMIVKDGDSREATSTTLVTILAAEPPEVTITPIYVEKVNPSQKLQIRGTVKSSTETSVTALWSSPQIPDLDVAASSATSLTLPAENAARDTPISLILSPLSLTGTSYTFYLTASCVGCGASGIAEVHIEVNEPPSGGFVRVEGDDGESKGIALTTKFKLSSLSWVDSQSDLPLLYSFSYYTASFPSTAVVTSSLSAVHENVYLPMGEGEDSIVYVVGTVSDKYGSVGQATASVTVTRPNLVLEQVGEETQKLTSLALEEGDTGTVFQVISSSASILNTVDCSNAPSCSSLNRLSCSDGDTAHTCGICQEGYVGVRGTVADNSACSLPVSGCKNGVMDGGESDVDCGGSDCEPCSIGKSCTSDGDCFFDFCGSDNICAAPVRTCPRECSGNGECKATDFNGNDMPISDCKENVACEVKCLCDDSHYGTDCANSQEDQEEVMKQRRDMLHTLKSVSSMQDVTKEAVGQQAAGLESLVKKVEELDDAGKILAFELVRNISASCKSNVEGGRGITAETATAIAESVSSLMVTEVGDGGSIGAAGGVEISEAVNNLAEAQIGSMFVGEDPVVVVTDNLKVSSEKVTTDSVKGKLLKTPQSRLDVAAGRESASLKFADDGVTGVFGDSCKVGISVAELGRDLNGNGTTFGTTLMRLGMGCYGGGGAATSGTGYSPILVTLPKTKSGGGGIEGGVGGGSVTEYCDWDEYKTTTCPGNSTEFAICKGFGQFAGNVTIECSAGGEELNCGMESGKGWAGACTVVHEGAENITCSCDVLGSFTGGEGEGGGGEFVERRRLNTIYDDQQSDDVGDLDQIGK